MAMAMAMVMAAMKRRNPNRRRRGRARHDEPVRREAPWKAKKTSDGPGQLVGDLVRSPVDDRCAGRSAFGRRCRCQQLRPHQQDRGGMPHPARSEEHTSELQSLMRISYAVFCLKTKQIKIDKHENHDTI